MMKFKSLKAKENKARQTNDIIGGAIVFIYALFWNIFVPLTPTLPNPEEQGYFETNEPSPVLHCIIFAFGKS